MLRILLVLATALLAGIAFAAELILPQGRTAYYATEPIELAVAGLAKGAAASIELKPDGNACSAVTVPVVGDGSTVTMMLPAQTLAPGVYTVNLDGKPTPVKLTIATGIYDSTMLISQTQASPQIRATSGNFIVGNAGSFGLIGPDGQPDRNPRGKLSGGMQQFNAATAIDLPTIIYMYWTGYVTHKPWGTRKSWEEASMTEAMRLFSLHDAQRLRRFKNIDSVGTLDEPGLNWGKTPTGGWGSGFANWDGAPWFARRGWEYTDNPAARPDADWLKYNYIRDGIIGEQQAQAHKDLKSIWPDVRFSTDNYAVHIVMDGADAMSQRTNDIPCTHIFVDWGLSRVDSISSLYVEKSHDPLAPVAHAMNGQLMGGPMPSNVQQDCYRASINSLLAGGIRSNWWLNWGAIKPEDLAQVNEPVRRLGPVFAEMRPSGHDVAILWSQTEIIMRSKDIVAKTAQNADGKPIKLMIATLPENTAVKGNYELNASPYLVGQNYREQIQTAHQALTRAGFPAHIVHERILPEGALKNYKVLVIVGQTTPLPAESQQAIDAFIARGGKVIVDATTTLKFKGAIATSADFKDPAYRWEPLFLLADQKQSPFKTVKEGSYFQTNFFMDETVKKDVVPMKAAMAQTASKPAFASDSTDLIFERHLGGQGALYMVLNAHEQLPQIPDDQRYMVWNYAPYTATYTLQGIKAGSAVYLIEGADWGKVTQVTDFTRPQTGQFAAGEMKLYLVAPRAPKGLQVNAKIVKGMIQVNASLDGLRMPWPLKVTIANDNQPPLYTVYRATNTNGVYQESFPIGENAPAGTYTVNIESPVAGIKAQAQAVNKPAAMQAQAIDGTVRVFDAAAINAFLAGKPAVTIAVNGEKYRAQADALATGLNAKGIKATVADEKAITQHVRYPRVVDPYLKVYKATPGAQPAQKPEAAIEVTLQHEDDGRVTAITGDGKDLGDGWRQPNTLATIGPKGYIEYSAGDGEEMYEPGCCIYIDNNRKAKVLVGTMTEVKATAEARKQWSRPWTRLASYNGGYNLTPQLPEAYAVDSHLILLGDSTSSELVAALQASELLMQVADTKYPGPGKALLSFAWSPFGLEKNAILIGAGDEAGVNAGVVKLLEMAAK